MATRRMWTAMLLAVAVTALSPMSWAGRARGTAAAGTAGQCQLPTPTGALSDQEAADLLHLRQEEKLARDVYQALYPLWNLAVFDTIAVSEQHHVSAVLTLMAAYGLEDPLPEDVPGTFADLDLQDLYDALVTAGSESATAALRVGATIEDMDIADLDAALAIATNPDLQRVLTNLVAGSENHLRAFVRQLARSGVAYTPQFITQERFDTIVGTASGHHGGNARRR